MNDYEEKICPFCKSKFELNDNIVICSQCDMPHHKECWVENQGCTTFGCLGTIKCTDGGSTSVTSKELLYDDISETNSDIVYCTHCGAINSSTSSFCSKCGTRLVTSMATNYSSVNSSQQQYPYQQSYSHNYNQNTYQNNTNARPFYGQYTSNVYAQQTCLDNDLIRLIGEKKEYYVAKFQELKNQNKKTSWNWAAFLVAPYWFIYRKMYAYGYGVLLIACILSFIPSISFLTLVGYIAFGLFADYIYMNELEKKLQQAKSMAEPMKSQYMQEKGGTNTLATAITIIVYFVFLLIIYL
ncbi:MAG: RING finger protein [Acutalibacteraceae bacterium]|nr:RING finger protein [Acutalibacteraceae bacterium]